jgi:hypothetical protein
MFLRDIENYNESTGECGCGQVTSRLGHEFMWWYNGSLMLLMLLILQRCMQLMLVALCLASVRKLLTLQS